MQQHPSAHAPLLDLHQLRKSFGSHEVLKGVSLQVTAGEVIAIIGASGSGKSTMLRCVNLLETPDSGTLQFQGKAVDYHPRRLSWRRAAQLRNLRSQIGMVFQNYNL